MSNGKIILVLGETGSGKSSFIKDNYLSQFKSTKNLCYCRMRTDFDEVANVEVITNFMVFLKKANKAKNKVCIIDEAFTCLPDTLNIKMDNPDHPHNQLADFLVNSRKMNRWVVIILHSFAQIPTKWLLYYVDWFIRYPTNDMLQYQEQRFKSFPSIANNLKQVPVVKEFTPQKLKLKLR